MAASFTLNPAKNLDPQARPNVGQFGWTGLEAGEFTELLKYVELARGYQEQAKTYAEQSQGIVTGTLAVAVKHVDDIYSDFIPKYQHVVDLLQSTDVGKFTADLTFFYNVIDVLTSGTQNETLTKPDGTTVTVVPVTNFSTKSANLSDLTDITTARTNLSVYSKSEVDGKIVVVNTAFATGDTNTLSSAKAYTDVLRTDATNTFLPFTGGTINGEVIFNKAVEIKYPLTKSGAGDFIIRDVNADGTASHPLIRATHFYNIDGGLTIRADQNAYKDKAGSIKVQANQISLDANIIGLRSIPVVADGVDQSIHGQSLTTKSYVDTYCSKHLPIIINGEGEGNYHLFDLIQTGAGTTSTITLWGSWGAWTTQRIPFFITITSREGIQIDSLGKARQYTPFYVQQNADGGFSVYAKLGSYQLLDLNYTTGPGGQCSASDGARIADGTLPGTYVWSKTVNGRTKYQTSVQAVGVGNMSVERSRGYWEWVGIDKIHVNGYAHVADKTVLPADLAILLPKECIINDIGYNPDTQVITHLGQVICVGANVNNGGKSLFIAVDSTISNRNLATIHYHDDNGILQNLKWNQLTNISDNCYFIYDITYPVAG